EADRAAARPTERLQKLLQHLVRSVCGPEIFHADAHTGLLGQVGSKIASQRDRVPIRVPVQVRGDLAHGARHVVDEGGRRRVRILVGVQPYWDVELRRAVRHLATEVVTQGQIVQRDTFAGRHDSNLLRTASPCAGRSSAFANVMTWPETSFNAASVYKDVSRHVIT